MYSGGPDPAELSQIVWAAVRRVGAVIKAKIEAAYAKPVIAYKKPAGLVT